MMFLLIVTLTSMLLAAIMSVIAWRLAGDERRRSEARVAALSAEIHEAAPAPATIVAQAGASQPRTALASRPWDEDLEIRPALGRTHRSAPTVSGTVTPTASGTAAPTASRAAGPRASATPTRRVQEDMAYTDSAYKNPPFTDLLVPTPSGSRAFVVLGGGALVLGAAVALAILFSGGGMDRAPRSPQPIAAATAAPAARPLELVALGHERVGDQLTVRGIVRNPAAGTGMDRLTAVVSLFTPDGGFLASGRADVASPALRPGGESTFVVTVPGVNDVGTYRVSFRTDNRLVPHLDRRHES